MAKRIKTEPEICPEDAGLWTKIHNEPYMRAHPKYFVMGLIWSFVSNLLWFMALLVVCGYVIVNVRLWPLV